MITKYRFELKSDEGTHKTLTCPGVFVAFTMSGYTGFIWTSSDESTSKLDRVYTIVMDGEDIPENSFRRSTYIQSTGTPFDFLNPGGTAYHLFEVW